VQGVLIFFLKSTLQGANGGIVLIVDIVFTMVSGETGVWPPMRGFQALWVWPTFLLFPLVLLLIYGVCYDNGLVDEAASSFVT
jgi:hypothetical protein